MVRLAIDGPDGREDRRVVSKAAFTSTATLTVVAGNLYRLLALKLSCYERATPSTLWRDFLDATGTLHIDESGVICALNLRSHHPVLIDAGFADLQTPIPWWGNERTLRSRFPPR